MIDTVALLGAKGEDVERQLMDVYNLEEKLANVGPMFVDFIYFGHFEQNGKAIPFGLGK